MRRGTTPTIKMAISGVDVTELNSIYITLRQGEVSVDKHNENILIDTVDNVLICSFTQEETLKFIGGEAYIQMRAVKLDGNAIATNTIPIKMNIILKDGVIE